MMKDSDFRENPAAEFYLQKKALLKRVSKAEGVALFMASMCLLCVGLVSVVVKSLG